MTDLEFLLQYNSLLKLLKEYQNIEKDNIFPIRVECYPDAFWLKDSNFHFNLWCYLNTTNSLIKEILEDMELAYKENTKLYKFLKRYEND